MAALLLASLQQCKKDTAECDEIPEKISFSLPDTLFDYTPVIPAHIQSDPIFSFSSNVPSSNPQTNEGITLGRVLFYDKRLSNDNTISCASCHLQENAFSFPEQFSEGINQQITPRNSMAIVNMRWNRKFFWDLRENRIEDQVLQPIKHPGEMATNLDQLVTELSTIEDYKSLFEDAFGDAEVTEERVSKALSQFLRALASFDSKYDQGKQNEFVNFTPSEFTGMELFFSGTIKCNHCHTGELFQSSEAMSNGLDLVAADPGVGGITEAPEDMGQFKVVTLRNIELTAPYMHDGRFQTLEEVVEFYNSGAQQHPNLDHRFTVDGEDGGVPVQLNLTEVQKADLVAFLKTLSDENFIQDVRFSDPFD